MTLNVTVDCPQFVDNGTGGTVPNPAWPDCGADPYNPDDSWEGAFADTAALPSTTTGSSSLTGTGNLLSGLGGNATIGGLSIPWKWILIALAILLLAVTLDRSD